MSESDSLVYVSGRNPVREALEDGASIEKVYVAKSADARVQNDMRRQARSAGVPIQMVPAQRLERLVPGVNHQGVVAALSTVGYVDLDEMMSRIAPSLDDVRAKKPIVVVLDGIQDPHNLGAILRSAVAVGAEGAIVPGRGSAPLNAAALKASAGTARQIPVARVGNLSDALNQLKERGYWVVGADGGGAESVWELDWDRPLAIVIGGEHDGMGSRVRSTCDYVVRIPMRGPAESLNASVAAGVMLFAAIRHRGE